jgi:hypothetical protein
MDALHSTPSLLIGVNFTPKSFKKETCKIILDPGKVKAEASINGVFQPVTVSCALQKMDRKSLIALFHERHPRVNIQLSQDNETSSYKIDLADQKNKNITSHIYLEGKDSLGEYRIRLPHDNKKEISGKFQLKSDASGKFKKVELSLDGFNHKATSNITQSIIDDTGYLSVITKVEQAALPSLTLSLKNPDAPKVQRAKLPFTIASFNAKTDQKKQAHTIDSKPVITPSILLISHSKDLIAALEAGSTDKQLLAIANQMVESFSELQSPTSQQIQEIAELAEILNPNQQRIILAALSIVIKENVVENLPLLQAITSLLIKFQKAHYHNYLLNEIQHPVAEFKNPFEALDPHHLLEVLSHQLNSSHSVKNTKKLNAYLEAMVALLNTRIFPGTDTTVQDSYYQFTGYLTHSR